MDRQTDIDTGTNKERIFRTWIWKVHVNKGRQTDEEIDTKKVRQGNAKFELIYLSSTRRDLLLIHFSNLKEQICISGMVR